DLVAERFAADLVGAGVAKDERVVLVVEHEADVGGAGGVGLPALAPPVGGLEGGRAEPLPGGPMGRLGGGPRGGRRGGGGAHPGSLGRKRTHGQAATARCSSTSLPSASSSVTSASRSASRPATRPRRPRSDRKTAASRSARARPRKNQRVVMPAKGASPA